MNLSLLILAALQPLLIGQAAPEAAAAWRPPFGLDRVGTLLSAGAPAFQAEAEAVTDKAVNPVDLGAIFPPVGWLLLKPGEHATVRVAAFDREKDVRAHVFAWFASKPEQRSAAEITVLKDERLDASLPVPEAGFAADRDVLEVSIVDAGGAELWHKSIPVMLIALPPVWPKFGATQTLLRYDLPISVRDPKTGALSTLPYAQGWKPELRDVVVSLPNGSRYVFWRGSSYIPFWAGRHSTAMCYEWAEMISHPADAVDCVEPLMDKELRYGHVEIVESSEARVHVRWTYQSCDFNYKVWGDTAQEDYYFYSDGFGARVLTLSCSPEAAYELSEMIVLAPAGAYPLSFMPKEPIRSLALDGTVGVVPIPFTAKELPHGPEPPLVYRVQMHKDDRETAIYFDPLDLHRSEELLVFGPFQDHGVQVTPAYWGSHWPLARGNATGGAIDDRIAVSPSHNSLMSWAKNQPAPISDHTGTETDALGVSRTMRTRKWAWMIGLSDAPDAEIIARAKTFTVPVE